MDEKEMVSLLMKAYVEKQLFPLLSQFEPDLDIKKASEIQKIFVQKRLTNDKIAGFKVAFTTEGAQKKFGVNSPVIGILFVSGKLEGSPIVSRTDFRELMIETEIGYILGERITQPLRDIDELRQKVRSVMPAIELPDLGFANIQALKGIDIIAANAASAKFIFGKARSHQGLNLNQVDVTFYYNGQIVHQSKGKEALGDQWKTAFWLVNSVIDNGYNIESGHILITGALGQVIPGKPGQYVADYGDFGKISFEVI